MEEPKRDTSCPGYFAALKVKYLEEYYPSKLARLIKTKKLEAYLQQVEEQCQIRKKEIIERMQQIQEVSELWKSGREELWRRVLTETELTADAIILVEIIYKKRT